MAAGNDDDPVLGHGGSGGYLNISRDALLADDPHEAYIHTRNHRSSIGLAIGVTVGLALAGSIGWYVYNHLPGSVPADNTIPILRAVPEVVKVRPDNPGGLDVPNRDKLIYQQMGETIVASGGEEHLLPPIETLAEPPESKLVGGGGGGAVSSVVQTEAPRRLGGDLTIPVVTVGPSEEGPFHEAIRSPVAPMPAPVPPATLPQLKTAIRPERPVSSLSELIARRVELPPVHRKLEEKRGSTVLPVTRPATSAITPPLASLTSPIAKAAVGVPQSAGSGGGARLQLGSFKNAEDAERAWLQLVSRHRDLLGGIVHTLVQVNLGATGSWYRVYAGPYSDMQAALSVCFALKRRSVECVFTRK